MEQLTWTGALGPILNPLFFIAVIAVLLSAVATMALSLMAVDKAPTVNADGTLAIKRQPHEWAEFAFKISVLALLMIMLAYMIGGILISDITAKGIVGALSTQLLPVWIAMIATFALSITFKRRLGLYGKLFDNTVGMIGLGFVLFWVFAALFQSFDLILTHDPINDVMSAMRRKVPGTPVSNPGEGVYPYYLLGGNELGRDVFSRVIAGSAVVLKIAPAATLFAFMAGIVLGVPAGYFGGRLDQILSFIANLVLAFPVILLFFLLVTPELIDLGIPTYMAAALFLFPVIFLVVLLDSRFHTNPNKRILYVGSALVIGLYCYVSLVWGIVPLPISFSREELIVFVSVLFVNSPTVFRIVRGLTLDIRTRDYVAAAQTRGERSWYIMLWEILPNARGPLLVDFCLRIGYTTILLGTLGFFGLGLPPESPDWGTSINGGRGVIQFFPFPALVPAVAIMSLVLGLNLLADGLREESLKD